MIRKLKQNRGYTIAELLAVISILVIISGIISGILYSTLRGSNKTRITTEVSQNGSYVVSVLSSIITDSNSVTQINGGDISDCTASPVGDSITLERLDGEFTTLSCAGNTISSNSVSLINTNQVQIEEGSCSFSCAQLSDDPYAVPMIQFTFRVKDKDSAFFENQAGATFESSVSLRNYSP